MPYSNAQRDSFLAQLSEWAYVTEPGNPSMIDSKMVGVLLGATFGRDWEVGLVGSWSSSAMFGPHLAYLVAFNASLNVVALAFQGTSSPSRDFNWTADALKDWLMVNVSTGTFPYDFPAGIGKGQEAVHSGFHRAYQAGRIQIFRDVRRCAPTGNASLWITGHSLGAALANLAFIDAITLKLQRQLDDTPDVGAPRFHITSIYGGTFSGPPIGNQPFEDAVNKLMTAACQQTQVKINGTFFETKSEVLGDYPGLYHFMTLGHFTPSNLCVSLDFSPNDFLLQRFPLSHYITHYVYFLRTLACFPLQAPFRRATSPLGSPLTVVLGDVTCISPVTVTLNCVSPRGSAPQELARGTITQADGALTLEVLMDARLRDADAIAVTFTSNDGLHSMLQHGVDTIVAYLQHEEVYRLEVFTYLNGTTGGITIPLSIP